MVEQYEHFGDHPGFTPMYTPEQLFEMGIMGGHFSIDLSKYPKLAGKDFPRINNDLVYESLYHYKVYPKHDFYDLDTEKMFSIPDFLTWYTGFYYRKRDKDKDAYFIKVWYKYILHLYDKHKVDPVTPAIAQTFLDVAWNYKFKPNFNIPWMQKMYP